ncbi:MAG: class I SAM-dependent methyltransferase [Nitrospiraceae bacterium]
MQTHLARWGLRQFKSDDAYFRWQRETLSPADLAALNRRIEAKRAPGAALQEDIAFYDLTAQSRMVPVLYSQRYDYYLEIGPRVVQNIGDARTILDFGCGVGILTTFYAQQFPNRTFLGLDRSPASIDLARQRAGEIKLENVRFECIDLDREHITGMFDLVIATHALLQAEREQGIPSRNWQTFERAHDVQIQQEFERRTGVGPRLDQLISISASGVHMIVFEKTRPLARRVPFQRAMAARRLRLLEVPEPVRYTLVEEIADDGPFYVVSRLENSTRLAWDESPEGDEDIRLDLEALRRQPRTSEEPLYENHAPSAQRAWAQLQDRRILKELTRQEPDGRQLHAELGAAEGYSYLYVANTFDQRQLVIVEVAKQAMMESYYEEIAGS